jgi:hypothetical protein
MSYGAAAATPDGQRFGAAKPVSSTAYYTSMVLIALLSIWLRTAIPIFAISNAGHDDQLFVRTARYLLAGEWLGPYDNRTLAKGIFYPFFIDIAFYLSIPLKIAEQIVYLVASFFIATLVTRASTRRGLGLTLFACLAFNPVLWNYQLARVIREGIYVSLCLAFFSSVALASFPELRKKRHSLFWNTMLGVGLGLIAAGYWLTREEGVWLIPGCIVLVTIGLVRAARILNSRLFSRSAFTWKSECLKEILLPVVVGMMVFVCGTGLVAALNYRYYGVWKVNELTSSSGFIRAYGALSRIKHDHWRRFIPLPSDARQRAYAVSPAARELAPSLDGELGHGWQNIGCSAQVDVRPCTEITSGVFLWALRDAVAQAGHYRSAPEAKAFYEQLANEINAACDRHVIPCLPARATLMPPFRWEYVGDTIKSAKVFATIVFTMGKADVGTHYSAGSPAGIANFEEITGGAALPADTSRRIEGWVAASSSTPTLSVVHHTDDAVQNSIEIFPAPDVAAVMPGLKPVRFSLESDCPPAQCDLSINSVGGQVAVPFSALVHGAAVNTPSVVVYIDHSSAEDAPTITARRRSIQMKAVTFIAKAYTKSARAISLLALFGLLLGLMRFKKGISMPLLAMALGSLAAIAARICLLAYIDATSFFDAFLMYCSPTSTFVILFAVLGIYVGWSSLFQNPETRSAIRISAASPDEDAIDSFRPSTKHM